MVGKLLLTASIVAVFVGAFLLKGLPTRPPAGPASDAPPATRIVSLAPSVTETLFALGLGDRVVGVTRFCNYPPEVKTKARIGGFLDPNIEAIVALKPDLLVMLVENRASQPAFEDLNVRMLVVDHRTVEGTLDSITAVGRACGAEARAETMVADLRARIDRVARKTAGLPRPRVLFSISRAPGAGRPEDVYVAGGSPYFASIVKMAGAENVFAAETAVFPVVSTEGILHANPEVIIDMVPLVSSDGRDVESLLADWRQIPEIDAVKHDRVYALDDDFASVPGPRFILLVEKVAAILHPEVDWE
jgi:iron complex transport system substrate-binding protein